LLALYFIPAEPPGMAGWHWITFMPGVFAIATLFVQRKLPESPRWLARHGDVQQALRTIAELEARIVASGRALVPAAAKLDAGS
jgi:putative MFS transporter